MPLGLFSRFGKAAIDNDPRARRPAICVARPETGIVFGAGLSFEATILAVLFLKSRTELFTVPSSKAKKGLIVSVFSKSLFLSVCSLALPSVSFAFQNPSTDDEIIIEGTRLPTPLAETGTAITVVQADEIEAKAYQFLIDALAAAPGVTTTQTGSYGGVANVRIRGGSVSQSLVLLDGVPIGDPSGVDGAYDFSLLDTAEIERVEILRGAQSTLWGSDAMGGVINIISKQPDQGLEATVFVEGGAFNTARGGATLSGANQRGGFRLAATTITTDGISKADEANGNTEEDGYDGATLSAQANLALTNTMRLDAHLRYMENDFEIDGFVPPSFALADTADTSEAEQLIGNLRLTLEQLEGSLTHQFSVGGTKIDRGGVFGGFASGNEGERTILRYQGTATVNDNYRLAFGVEQETASSESTFSPKAETDNQGLFLLVEAKQIEGLTLTGGLRRDDHSDFGGVTTGRAAFAYDLGAFVFRGSYSQGYKAPTVFQLTSSFGPLPPNADLQPETSEGFDLGVDWQKGRTTASLTYFSRHTEDEIIFDLDSRYSNLDETEATGVEADFAFGLSETLSLNGSYTYIDATNSLTGLRQIRTPEHSGDLTLAYQQERLSGNITARYNGEELENARFGPQVDAWTRLDIAGNYQLTPMLGFYARIENITDEDYQQVSGYGTPGRSAYGGLRLKL